MNNKLIMFLAVLLTIALLVPSVSAEKKYDLQMRLKEGKTYRLLVTTDQQITQEVMGIKQEIKQTMGMGFIYEVEKVDPFGNMTVKTKFDRILFKMDTALLGVVEYDSANPPDEVHPVASIFSSMVGKELRMVLTPEGEVKDFEGMGSILSNALDSVGEKKKDPKVACYIDSIKEQLSDDKMIQNFSQMSWMIPDNPVSIGDSWTDKQLISSIAPMTIINTCTLKDMKWRKAIVDVTSMIKPNPDGEPMQMGPMTMNYELSGEQYGTLEIDRRTGLVIGGTLTQEISGKIVLVKSQEDPCKDKEATKDAEVSEEAVDVNASVPEEMSIPMTIKSVATYGTY